jgi:hypothetical protein
MRYFFDTEFFEDGTQIHPISFGMVCEDGRELYMEFRHGHLGNISDWVKENVLPHLHWENNARLLPPEGADRLVEFIGDDSHPEFWAYFADYDWIFLCQMFGTMIQLPDHFPMLAMDLQQWYKQCGAPKTLKPPKPTTAHTALGDAKWNEVFYKRLQEWNAS